MSSHLPMLGSNRRQNIWVASVLPLSLLCSLVVGINSSTTLAQDSLPFETDPKPIAIVDSSRETESAISQPTEAKLSIQLVSQSQIVYEKIKLTDYSSKTSTAPVTPTSTVPTPVHKAVNYQPAKPSSAAAISFSDAPTNRNQTSTISSSPVASNLSSRTEVQPIRLPVRSTDRPAAPKHVAAVPSTAKNMPLRSVRAPSRIPVAPLQDRVARLPTISPKNTSTFSKNAPTISPNAVATSPTLMKRAPTISPNAVATSPTHMKHAPTISPNAVATSPTLMKRAPTISPNPVATIPSQMKRAPTTSPNPVRGTNVPQTMAFRSPMNLNSLKLGSPQKYLAQEPQLQDPRKYLAKPQERPTQLKRPTQSAGTPRSAMPNQMRPRTVRPPQYVQMTGVADVRAPISSSPFGNIRQHDPTQLLEQTFPVAARNGDQYNYAQLTGSDYIPSSKGWLAPNFYSRPLYFEETQLERYGNSLPFQSVVSAAHFFGTIPLLPYKMGAEQPYQCTYTYGVDRPGNCVAYEIEHQPISPRGLLSQAFWTSVIALP